MFLSDLNRELLNKSFFIEAKLRLGDEWYDKIVVSPPKGIEFPPNQFINGPAYVWSKEASRGKTGMGYAAIHFEMQSAYRKVMDEAYEITHNLDRITGYYKEARDGDSREETRTLHQLYSKPSLVIKRWSEILSDFKDSRSEEAFYYKYSRIPWLIIDDIGRESLGTEYLKGVSMSVLTELLDRREGVLTGFTSNIHLDKLPYNDMRIRDRIYKMVDGRIFDVSEFKNFRTLLAKIGG